MVRLASLKAQGLTMRPRTSNQQIEGADKDGEGTLSQAAAAVAPTNEHALKNRQQAFKGLESLGLSAAEIAKIEGGGSESPSRGASKEQVGDDDGDDASPAPPPGPGVLKRS